MRALVDNQNNLYFSADPCAAGQALDPSKGCQNCPADEWSAANNQLTTCTPCPSGKGVAAGSGTSEADCTWSQSKLI